MGERTYSPRVYFLVILHSHEDLRRQIERSTTDSGSELFGTVDRPAKVAYLCHTLNRYKPYVTKNDVFEFDVPVDRIMLMHIFDSLADLANYNRSRFFRKSVLLLKDVVEMPVTSQFQ